MTTIDHINEINEPFGVLLRRFRTRAALSQERLAERAGISADGIAALEAGRRRAPRSSTVALLVAALELTTEERAALVDSAARPVTGAGAGAAGAAGGGAAVGGPVAAGAVAGGAAAGGAVAGAVPAPARATDTPADSPAPAPEPVATNVTDDTDVTSDTNVTNATAATNLLRRAGDVPRPARTRRPFPGVNRTYELVGRTSELARLEASRRRRRDVVLVLGEAGVGKTRLVGEFATAAAEAGDLVLWGRCTPERLGAYEPWVEVVRAAAAAEGPDSALVSPELVRLVPELAPALGVVPQASRADAGVERRLLFDAIRVLLGGGGPTVVVLDDLHWADAGTLALLAYLVAPPAPELTIVATVRSTDLDAATAGALAELRRHCQVERFTLDGLDVAGTAALMALVAGEQVSASLLGAVSRATDGNPLFVEELTEHLLARGYEAGVDDADVRITVPEGVRDTLGSRIARLSPEAQALLRAGAVLGREFPVPVAGRLAGIGEDRLVAAAEDALLSSLVTEPAAHALSFSHALVQASVYEAMSASRRVELHRQAGQALAEAAASTTGEPTPAAVFDLAHHWSIVAAVDATAAATAAHWAVRAGDAAAAAADSSEAIVRYEQATSWWSTSTAEHADALVRLGRALAAASRSSEADDRFTAALALAEGLGDTTLYARAALGLATTLVYGHSDQRRIDVLERAIRRLGPDEHVLRPAALAMLVRQLGFDHSPDAYRRRQEAAATVLAEVTGPHATDEMLVALGSARDSIPVDLPIALGQLTSRMVSIATTRRDLPMLANAWYGRAWSTLELGDAPGWHEAVAGYGAVADQLRLPFELAQAAAMRATAALIEGRYNDAEAASHQALAHASSAGDENGAAVHLANAVMRGLDRGEAAEMVDLMLAVQDQYTNVGTFHAGLAMTAGVAGRKDVVVRLLEERRVTGFHAVRRDAEWLPVIGFLCCACGLIGDRRYAEELYDVMAHAEARTLRVGPLAGWWGAVDHHLGVLCRVLGRLDEAEARLANALDIEEAMGAQPYVARTKIELATTLAVRGGHDEVRSRLLDEAVASAKALGATGIAAMACVSSS